MPLNQPEPQAMALQRATLLRAMADIVGKGSFEKASVTAVCERAGLSKTTFYRHFESREECFLGVLADAYQEGLEVIQKAYESTKNWRDGIREALASILILFDSKPGIARILMIESVAAGAFALQYREGRIPELTEAVMEHWDPPDDVATHPMIVTGVMTSVLGAIQRHLSTEPDTPLIHLLPGLMAIVTDPFLDADQVNLEVRTAEELADTVLSRDHVNHRPGLSTALEIPARLLQARAYRARQCLVYLARCPGRSNREIGEALGISSASQISILLSRLAELDLIQKRGADPGMSNAWFLTLHGLAIANALSNDPDAGRDQSRD